MCAVNVCLPETFFKPGCSINSIGSWLCIYFVMTHFPFFLIIMAFTPALGHCQLPIKWVLRAVSQGGNGWAMMVTTYLQSTAMVKNVGTCVFIPPFGFMVW
jgi:hypothetical protein